jgi:hypothetical protein
VGVPVDQLPFQTQDQYVASMTTAYGGSLGIVPLLEPGDPALAVFQAVAVQDVFIQFLLQAVWAGARLSTATGDDVDSFVADFSPPFTPRLPATYATGPVTLTALTAPTVNVLIPAGTVIQAPGGAIQYQLIADTTQTAWSASLNGYVLLSGQTTLTATAQALVAGSAYNVQPGQLTQFQTAIAGIDQVTNGAAITNGLPEETDAQVKARFVQFIASLSEATEAALLFAINSVQQGLDILPLENTNVSFEAQNGINTFVIDNGTGSPPASLLNACLTAMNTVRAFGIQIADRAPIVSNVTIALTVLPIASPTESNTVLQTNVQAGVLAYVNGILLSQNQQTLYLNDIVAAAKAADSNVLAVVYGSVTINSVAADLVIGEGALPRTTLSGVTVTVG